MLFTVKSGCSKSHTSELKGNLEESRPESNCYEFLSYLGYAIGFGNVWSFPYLCYKHGGLTFLIPYIVMLIFIGIPLFFMELALGQYFSLGPTVIFQEIAPFYGGLGWAMVGISTLVSIYYNMIMAWIIFYTAASLPASFSSVLSWIPIALPWISSALPWSHCKQYWLLH